MPALKIGIQLSSLQLPFKKALHTAAQLGAHAVEIDARGQLNPSQWGRTAARHLRITLEKLDLRVCALGFRTRWGYDVLEGLDRRITATRDAMKLAYELGAAVVVNRVGQIGGQQPGPQWDLLVEVLGDLGNYAQRTGAWLAAETGTESGEDMARLIDALPEGLIGVNLDPGKLIINGFSPSEAVAALGPHILHVHATDGVRDLAQGRGLEVPLGRGSADFPALLGALEDHDYRGYFTIERADADDPVTEIGQALQYLRNL